MRPGRLTGIVIAALLAACIVALAVQNPQTAHVSWFWLDANVPLWTLLGVTSLVGLVIGAAGAIAGLHRARNR